MSDMALSEAVAECAKWGNLMRALGKVREVAQSAQALEQSRAERQSAVDTLGTSIKTRTAELAALDEQVKVAKASAAQCIADAQQRAASLLSAARAEAAELTAKARATADLADSQARDLRAQADQVKQELDTARNDLAAATERIATIKAEALAKLA